MAGSANKMQMAGMGLALLLGAVWLALGGPLLLAERWLWPTAPTPWEVIDARYMPDLARPAVARTLTELHSLSTCRGWAQLQAIREGNPMVARGGYGCDVRRDGLVKACRLHLG
jgi:hypothetical protein